MSDIPLTQLVTVKIFQPKQIIVNINCRLRSLFGVDHPYYTQVIILFISHTMELSYGPENVVPYAS